MLRLIAAGKPVRQAADALTLSESTVNRHIANIYNKIGAHNRAEATLWAVRSGLVEG